MRKFIISAVGLLIIAAGFFVKNHFSSRERPERPKEEKALPIVFIQNVTNTSLPVTVTASGNLEARDRIEIYSEVQGVFDYSSHAFKPGIYYGQGETLLRLNSDEYRANLRSQKSALYNQVVALLPDLKFDYPYAFDKWKNYVTAYNVEGTLASLPTASDEKEKLFIAGRNISSTWYNVKNAEERLSKYQINAPFNGVLTIANIDKGALVRAGQKLGEFINPNVLELEVAVNSSYAEFLKIGNSVSLSNVEKTKSYTGTVNRLNSLIDPGTQTIQAYIRVRGKGLREGMYLEAELNAEEISDAFEISRKLLVNNNQVYVLENDKIVLTDVDPVHFMKKTVLIKGLPNGTPILSRTLPGAYDGMQVKVYEE